jgi:serine/threonine protein kinase/Tol biopolymer transport system component
MALSPGTKLGPYEIVAPLGAGGMGEVYRARDAKLARDVALKIISPEFAHDVQRMARFQREAQVLASLNHTHIASIYGLEESGGMRALVMELVEGPTLAERIQQGAIPLDEALPIARQIAEALECAHERGIVHRDLKPANIKLTQDGNVKVLDFGLAKALLDESSSGDISNSPTLTMATTKAGLILGTAAYMAPEQAKGKSVDRRADIWSFGVVLYEMLTAEQVFGGETVSDALASIIKDTPNWGPLPKGTPKPIRDLLQRCLQKDPRQRLQSIGDARITLEEVISGSGQSTALDESQAPAPSRAAQQAWQRYFPWALAAILGVAFAISLFVLFSSSVHPATKPIVLSLNLPPGQELDRVNGPAVAISPDGSLLAYVTREPGTGAGQLYLRELAKGSSVMLEGTGLAAAPFFSPDNQWVGFFGDGKLKKVSIHGGAPISLADVTGYRGGDWGEDGTIIFPNQFTSSLFRVPASGGEPKPATHLDLGHSEITHRWPQFLPGDKAVIFTVSADNNYFGHATVEAAPLDTGTPKVLVENAYFGRYLSGGYLAYVSQGTVFVAPFNAKSLTLTGTAIPVLQGVDSDLTNGGVQLSVSQIGTIVYSSGTGVNQNLNVALLDRKGDATVLLKDEPGASSPRFSPDGKHLAFQKEGGAGIWIYDMTRGTTTPINLNRVVASYPIWTPDGKRITYAHPRTTEKGSGQAIYWQPADGTGQEEVLTSDPILNAYPASWSPDGKVLAFERLSPKSGSCCEVWTLTMGADGKPGEPRPFITEESAGQSAHGGISIGMPMFSPDGHWVAYASTSTTVPQIFVIPFPGPGGKWQVSTDGGDEALWSKSGHDLFFRSGTKLVSVPFTVDKNTFVPGRQQVLFQDRFEARVPFPSYDVTPDSQHFVVFQFPGGKRADILEPTVVLNWFDEVRRQVAAGQSGAPR